MSAIHKAWADHALAALDAAGYRKGVARLAVVDLLGRQDCALTALEVEESLRERGDGVGRASVYRVLEQLEELSLVKRLEVSRGTASYERIEPSGDHHHHAVCRRCGRVEPFEDAGLEQAIARVSDGVGYEIAEHDVVLRGLCPDCARACPERNFPASALL